MDRRNSEFKFCFTKFVICVHKDRNNRIKCFDCAIKAAASASKPGNIMPQVCVDSLDRKGVIFVVYVANMLPWVNNADIAQIAVCAIFSCLRCRINNCLYSTG